jgi:hypothetical protein
MINIEFVKGEWAIDSKIDETEAGRESLKIAGLHNKYYNMLIDAKHQQRDNFYRRNKYYKLKWDYYLGNLSKEECDKYGFDAYQLNRKILRQDVNIFLDADAELCKMQKVLDDDKILVEYIMSIMSSLGSRSYEITNYINWNKFMAGMA